MKLHLIRHGETDWNVEGRIQGWAESELTATGRQQAEERREMLADIEFTALWCSSSIRTRQTAGILCRDRPLPSHFSDALREMHLGPWEGRLWADIRREDPERCAHFARARDRFVLDGAETFQTMQARGVQAIDGVVAASEAGADVLIVSHGAIIKAILARYAGLAIRDLGRVPGLQNCSHSILQVQPDGREVTLIDGALPETTDWPGVIAASGSRE